MNIKKIITVFVFLSSLFSVFCFAQDVGKFNGALLWKISGKGLAKPSFILGTHHLINTSFFNNLPGLQDAIKNTDQVVCELIISKATQAEMQKKVQTAGIMPAGESYEKLLSPEDYKKLDDGLKKNVSLGIKQLEKLKPAMLSQMCMTNIYKELDKQYDPTNNQSIDAILQQGASKSNKKVRALDTVDEQMSAVGNSEPLKKQADALVCLIGSVDKQKNMLRSLNAAYKKGQLTEIHRLSLNNPDNPCKATQLQESILTKRRNDKWIKNLPQIISEKSCLIAVGVLHLAGKDGLLFRLAQLGYTVEPVH